MTDLIDLSKMVRPWWRGIEGVFSNGDHIYADCEELAEEGEMREGWGWLNPYDAEVCLTCLRRFDPDECWKRTNDDY